MKASNSHSSKDFMPTDDELLQNFLYNKINNKPIPNYLNILEHDLFGTENTPLDIWNEFEASYSYGGNDLYFFTILKKKSAKDTRYVRTIGHGNWEGEDTGKDIFAKDSNKLLGLKKRYRFEKSNTPQDGGWILHEYNLHKSLINNPQAKDYVLCRFRKNLKPESQNTPAIAKASIADQSGSHLRKISRTRNCSTQREPIVIKQEKSAVISGYNVSVKKYIIYEEAIVEPNIEPNDGGNKRKYEDNIEFVYGGNKRKYEDNVEFVYKGVKRKCIRSTWPEEKKFLAMKAIFEYEYNKLFFGVDSRNSKEEEDEMSWTEFFAKEMLKINGLGGFINEVDVQMIANSFFEDSFSQKLME